MRFLVLLCITGSLLYSEVLCATPEPSPTRQRRWLYVPPGQPALSMPPVSLNPFTGTSRPKGYLASLLPPTSVLWPTGTVQNFGTFGCGVNPLNVSVEVYKPGVTDMPGQGTNIHCVVHLGKVTSFPSGNWTCIQNFSMTYTGDNGNGNNDIFSAAISSLPPGLYEFTCACSDQGVFTNPLDPAVLPSITWIGTSNPPNNFTDAQVTINNAALNDDCDPATAIPLNTGATIVNNDCSVDGKVWFKYTVTQSNVIVTATATNGTLTGAAITGTKLNSCSGPALGSQCLMAGDIIYVEAGKAGACPEQGTFTITMTQTSGAITPTSTLTDNSGIPSDGTICAGDGFTITTAPQGTGITYAWALNATSLSNTDPTYTIGAASSSNAGTYTITVTNTNGCSGTTSTAVTITTPPTASSASLQACETTSGGATASFTLTNANADVINGQTGVTVTYHATQAEANTNTNPLSSPYTSATGIIYARVTTTATGCYSTTTVQLTVNPAPSGVQIQNANNNNLPDNFSVCVGDPINLLVAGTGNGTLQYNWTLPSGTATGTPLNIASAVIATHSGTWNVTVTDGNGCTASDNIIITVDPAPANDECSGAIAFATSGTNECAGQDITTCGANSESSVWYNYTVPANIKTLTISVSGLTGGVVNVYDACSGTALGPTCTSSVTIDCPDAGDVFKIYVSSPSANEGSFTLTETATTISAPNDACSAAQAIAASPTCEFFSVAGTTTAGACPEGFSVSGCGLDYESDAIVWYSFTTPAGTTSVEFQNILGTLSIFSSCTSTTPVTGGGCLSGSGTVSVSGSTTYYVAIGLAGSSGPVGFDIKYNVGPANDVCGTANISLGSSGSANATNGCAGNDFSGDCTASSYESSVWFTVTVQAGYSGVEFTVNGVGTDAMTGGGAGTLFESGCTGTIVGEACFTVGTSAQILCIPPGTYDFQIATSAANEGDFSISFTQIAGGSSAPANDNCENAQVINMSVVCAPITVSGDNTNACHELFGSGTCNFDEDPVTWHTFTTDADAVDIDIANITGGAYIGIFESSPCGSASPTALSGAGCITTSAADIPVSGNTTYYIAVGHASGAAYTFQITQSAPPGNDTPCTAETIGSATMNNTCCANEELTSECGTGIESSVWFKVPTGPNIVTVNVSFSNISLTPPFTVDIFQGADCGSLTPVDTDIFRSKCNIANFNATLRCLDYDTDDLYIRVGSNQNTCGEFTLSATANTATCTPVVDCNNASPVFVPTDGQTCVQGCNLSFCGDGVCDPDGNATYYAFEVDPATASAIVISVTGASFAPIISIAPDCFSPYVSCFEGAISDPAPVGSGVVYVRIEAVDGEDLDDDFQVCANAFGGSAFDCYDATLAVTRPEHPTLPSTGPYCPGEVLNFCYTVNFIVSPGGTVPPGGNNCQWLQGIVPVVYEGFDLVALPLETQTGPAGASWLNEGVVHYNFDNQQYNLFTLPDGSLGIDWGSGSLLTDDPMPAGWYYASAGSGPNCTDPSNPDTAWGLPAACGSTQTVTFCFNLKVKEFETVAECEAANLKLAMFSFADGELGCWTNLSCALSTPFIWEGNSACNTLITITGDDKQVCSGQPVLITAEANQPNANISMTCVDNPNVTGETLSGTYGNQMSLLETLVNTSTEPQIVEYTLNGFINGQPCESPEKVIKVTVYPNIEGTFSPDPAYVCFPGDCEPLTIQPTGGSGTYTTYTWSGQGISGSGPTVTVCPTSPSEYTVTITDSFGCTGVESIEVDIKDPVTVVLDPTSLKACKDGIPGNTERIFATVLSGLYPYVYDWTNPPGIVGYGAPFFDVGNDSYVLLEEQSQATTGNLLLTVTDGWGCTGTATALISIEQGPKPKFEYLPFACGQTKVDLKATFDMGSSNFGLDRFELYTCDSTYLGVRYNNVSIFAGIDMSVYGNCFILRTYSGGSCVVERKIIVPLSNGKPINLGGNTRRCTNGSPAIIQVFNASDYKTLRWSNGDTTAIIVVAPAQTTSYTVTATEANGCISTASQTITVNPAPKLTYAGSTTFCPGQSTQLTAFSDIPGTTFLWTRKKDGSTSKDTFLVVNTPDTIVILATSPEGCTDSVKIVVRESNELTPNINEVSLCDNVAGTLDAGSGFDRYKWSTGDTTRTIVVTQPGQYWVEVAQATCKGRDTVTVINNLSPAFTLPSQPVSVCRTNEGFGPHTINFTSLLSPAGVSGTWSDVSGSGVDILTNLASVEFLGVPVGQYLFVFTSDGAVSPCVNRSDTLRVNVNACQCPEILPTGPLCNQGSAPVDMKTRKGNPTLGGTFSVINPTGITMNNGIFIPAGLSPGTYTIEWAITSQCRPIIDIIVYDNPEVSLTETEISLCNDNATGSATLNLNSLVQAGSSAGNWKQVSGNPSAFSTPPVVNGLGLQKGDVLVFRYTTETAQAPCGEDSIDVTITIRDCRCPEVSITPLTVCNGSTSTIDLNDPAVLTTSLAGISGVWTSSVLGAVTSNRYLTPLGILAGQHTITFSLDNPISGCPDKFTQNIAVSLQPVAESAGPASACNVNAGNGLTTIRLFDLLKPGYSGSGTWIQTGGSPLLPVTNNQVDFVGQPVGAVFRFTYTRTATAPCTPVSAEVVVTVLDCQCPPILVNTPAPICNESGILNLATLEQPGTAPGIWQVKAPSGNSIATVNKTLDARGLPEGIYRLTYVLSPSPQGNCAKDSTVLLRIERQNSAVLKDTTVCNTTAGTGSPTLDLRNLLISTTAGGKWLDDKGNEIANITNVSFVGKPLGSVTWFYEVPSAAPCVNRKIPFTITVVDCSCDQIDLGTIPSICTDKATFDLKPFSDSRPGSWTSSNPAVSIQNNVMTLTGLAAGVYELIYTLATAPPDPCPKDKKVLINIFNPRSAGTVSGARYCEGSTDVINLFERLDGESPGGTWSVIFGGTTGFSASAATFSLAGRPAGTYVFRYTIGGQAPCADDAEDVTIVVNPQPVADAGADKTLDCQVASVTIGSVTSSDGPSIVYEWKRGNDVVGTAKTLSVTEGGTYTLTVKDNTTTCASTDVVVVSQDAGFPVFAVEVDTIACAGQTATIRVTNIAGGSAPYRISLDGGASWNAVQSNSATFSSLKKGLIQLWVQDAKGCINKTWPAITITEPAPFTVNLGPDLLINLGETATLTPAVLPLASRIKSLQWLEDGRERADLAGAVTATFSPREETVVSVTAVNQSGCIASDDVLISLRRVKPECLPNIITPDKPGGNQYFSINCEEVSLVSRYSIFDRWGNLIFSGKNLLPSEPQSFWNGRLRGSDVVPGVYVFTVEMQFKDGSTETRSGDVTVIK